MVQNPDSVTCGNKDEPATLITLNCRDAGEFANDIWISDIREIHDANRLNGRAGSAAAQESATSPARACDR